MPLNEKTVIKGKMIRIFRKKEKKNILRVSFLDWTPTALTYQETCISKNMRINTEIAFV